MRVIAHRMVVVARSHGASIARYHARVAPGHPVTLAIRALRSAGLAFVPYQYDWEPHGGTAASAAALGVDEHAVVKTLIFEDDRKRPLCILMHGDREVSAKNLARALGSKSVAPCPPAVADKHSGYQIGGTSPFGQRVKMPLYVERTIATLPTIYVNGGQRGFLVALDPRDLIRVLAPTLVEVATT